VRPKRERCVCNGMLPEEVCLPLGVRGGAVNQLFKSRTATFRLRLILPNIRRASIGKTNVVLVYVA
jgi:hypothetical protein